MYTTPRSPTDGRARGGFTLVEVMVALTISAILAGVIFQLIRGQSRFVEVQGAREEVHQNARAALEILSSELRAVQVDTQTALNAPVGLLTADESTISFRSPRAFGIVCGTVAGGDLAVAYPTDASPVFRTGADRLAVRDSAFNAGWVFSDVSDRTATTGGLATALCNAQLQPNPAAGITVRSYSGAGAASANPGSSAYLFDVVTYDVGASSVPGTWLRRSYATDGGSPEPIAGPLAGSGAQFTLRYFDAAGSQLAAPAVPRQVRRVRVIVGTQSRSPNAEIRQTLTDSIDVFLRN